MTQHQIVQQLISDYIPKGTIGCEIGVWKGDGAQMLLKHAAPFKLYLIDPWIPVPEGHIEKYVNACWRDYTEEIQNQFYIDVLKRFQFEKAIEVIRAKSWDAVVLFPDEYFDWVFVDGDHSYDAVLKDLTLYGEKLKVGGYIMGDDYYGADWCYQVGLAVDDFEKNNKEWMEWITHSGEQYLMKKIAPKPEPQKPASL